MKTRIFNSFPKVEQIIFLICCLISILFLPHCTNQEKKTKVINEIKDTTTQKSDIDIKVDTTRGVFLIYKFGDDYNTVDNKTNYLISKGILSKREEDEGAPFGGKRTYFEYKIFTDPKYDFSQGGFYLGDHLVSSDDSYVIMTVSFEYTENSLYQIKLYTGITDDLQERLRILKDKNISRIWEEIASKNILALFDVYSKKYKGWIEINKKYGLNDFLHKQGNTQILIERYLYSVTVVYTDFNAQLIMKKKEKENLKKKMDEENKGI